GEVTVPIDSLGNKRGYRFFGKSESKFDLDIDKMELINPTGAHIPFSKLGLQRRIKDVLDGCRVAEELRISFLAKNVPPHGYRVYRLTRKDIAHTLTEYSRGVRIGDRYLENKFYRIEVQEDGTLRIKDKLSNKIFRDINKFEDSRDRGDLYNFASLTNDKIISHPNRVNCRVLENQGWKGVLEVVLMYRLPAKISTAAKLKEKLRFISTRFSQLYILAVLAGMFTIFSVTSPYFLTPINLENLAIRASLLLVLSIGMTFVLVGGEIDLSV
ncbi:unnamed protein product, partial [marine sediment metagenome]